MWVSMDIKGTDLLAAFAVAYGFGFMPSDPSYAKVVKMIVEYEGMPEMEWWNAGTLTLRRFDEVDASEIHNAWLRALENWETLTDPNVTDALPSLVRQAIADIHTATGKDIVRQLAAIAKLGAFEWSPDTPRLQGTWWAVRSLHQRLPPEE